MILWTRRILALLLIMGVCFFWGLWVASDTPMGQAPACQNPDYESMDAAQLANVAEGIQERISALQDELALVVSIQREKLEK